MMRYTAHIKVIRFQFHYGAIKTKDGTTTAKLGLNFNSIMVRLRLVFNSTRLRDQYMFQFHYGAIKTDSEESREYR